jgi:hypothetical protein
MAKLAPWESEALIVKLIWMTSPTTTGMATDDIVPAGNAPGSGHGLVITQQ